MLIFQTKGWEWKRKSFQKVVRMSSWGSGKISELWKQRKKTGWRKRRAGSYEGQFRNWRPMDVVEDKSD